MIYELLITQDGLVKGVSENPKTLDTEYAPSMIPGENETVIVYEPADENESVMSLIDSAIVDIQKSTRKAGSEERYSSLHTILSPVSIDTDTEARYVATKKRWALDRKQTIDRIKLRSFTQLKNTAWATQFGAQLLNDKKLSAITSYRDNLLQIIQPGYLENLSDDDLAAFRLPAEPRPL